MRINIRSQYFIEFQFSAREDFVDTKNETIAHVKRNMAEIINIPSHEVSSITPATFDPMSAPMRPKRRVVDTAIDLRMKLKIKNNCLKGCCNSPQISGEILISDCVQ